MTYYLAGPADTGKRKQTSKDKHPPGDHDDREVTDLTFHRLLITEAMMKKK